MLIGYGSIAYAAIRHMVESWHFCRCVETRLKILPALRDPLGVRSVGRPPTKNVRERLAVRYPEEAEVFAAAVSIRQSLSGRSHPPGRGVSQVRGEDNLQRTKGVTYRPELWSEGIGLGHPTAMFIAQAMGTSGPQGAERGATVARVAERLHRLVDPPTPGDPNPLVPDGDHPQPSAAGMRAMRLAASRLAAVMT